MPIQGAQAATPEHRTQGCRRKSGRIAGLSLGGRALPVFLAALGASQGTDGESVYRAQWSVD